MKILLAADVPCLPDAGAAGTEFRTMLALRELGHDVDAVWEKDLPHAVRHGNLHYLLELPRGYRDAVRRAREAAAYDVIHVNQPHAYLAAMDHQRSRAPGVFVNRSHGWELRVQEALKPWRKEYRVPEWTGPRAVPGRILGGLLGRHCRLAAAHAGGIIVSCSACRDFIVSHHGVDPERVACIAQAPPDSYAAVPPRPVTVERMRRVLYVGQFAFVKGVNVLGRVIDCAVAAHPDLSFTWVCDREDHAKAGESLSPQARGQTSFLEWRDQEHLRDVYDEHGIFLFPSLFEGFGKAFLEAMQRGLCVIASDEGGMRDVITDGHDGYLVPVGDVTCFVDRLTALLGDETAGQAVSTRAAETARPYTWRRTAEETVRFYGKLLELKARETGRN